MQSDEKSEKRAEYWRKKYLDPHWPIDIHYGLFPAPNSTIGLEEAVRWNTVSALTRLIDFCSIYRASTGLKVVDFGCGTGDLLIDAAETFTRGSFFGIDVSGPALQIARDRSKGFGNIEWIEGGIERLVQLFERAEVDVLLCRDVYYLLSDSEREIFWGLASRIQNGGLLFISDMVSDQHSLEAVTQNLVERQYGNRPVGYDEKGLPELYSLASDASMIPVSDFTEDSHSIRMSYLNASKLEGIPSAVRASYKMLTRGEEEGVDGKTIYGRYLFQKLTTTPEVGGASINAEIEIQSKDGIRISGKVILESLSLAIPVRHLTLFVGRSGAGKTTLLNLIHEHLLNKSQSVFMLSQEPALIEELTVRENIMMFQSSCGYPVESIILDLGLDEISDRMANSSLSGGEQQRVALAQAIVSGASVLLLDEPFTGIDKVRKLYFFQRLRSFAQKFEITVICVDHDFAEISAFFHRIYEVLERRLIRIL